MYLPELKYGATTRLARMLGLEVDTLYNWKKNGIPDEKIPAVKKALKAIGSDAELETGQGDKAEFANEWLTPLWSSK